MVWLGDQLPITLKTVVKAIWEREAFTSATIFLNIPVEQALYISPFVGVSVSIYSQKVIRRIAVWDIDVNPV